MNWLRDFYDRVSQLSRINTQREPRDFHIAILSFDRPDYLAQVLESLRPQLSKTDRVVLFQDGHWNPKSNRQKADPKLINQCVDLFKKYIPRGIVAKSQENLGIALNYERAERYVFEHKQADQGLFLEDDLVLSPNYLTVIRQLLDLAKQDARIGYVSAYGNLWASQEEQISRAGELIPMHENWGAALTRNAWLAEREFRQSYLQLVQDVDYSERDHARIRQFYRDRGWKNAVTSQDAARWIACLERGAVRVTTFSCHGRNIGERGEHFTPELFASSKFADTLLFEGSPSPLHMPTEQMIANWLDLERARFLGEGTRYYPGHLQS